MPLFKPFNFLHEYHARASLETLQLAPAFYDNSHIQQRFMQSFCLEAASRASRGLKKEAEEWGRQPDPG